MYENSSIDNEHVLDVVLDVISKNTTGFKQQYAQASLNEYGHDVKKFIDVISKESVDILRSELNGTEFDCVANLVSCVMDTRLYLIPDKKHDGITIRYC